MGTRVVAALAIIGGAAFVHSPIHVGGAAAEPG